MTWHGETRMTNRERHGWIVVGAIFVTMFFIWGAINCGAGVFVPIFLVPCRHERPTSSLVARYPTTTARSESNASRVEGSPRSDSLENFACYFSDTAF